MFEVCQTEKDGFEVVQIINTIDGCAIEILPEHGCLLNGFIVMANGKQLSVMDGYKSKEDLEDNLLKSYKGIKLFPFPNRVAGGKYSFDDEDFQLDINEKDVGNNLHAFVYYQEFSLSAYIEEDDFAMAQFVLDYDGDEEGYPFPFKLFLEFEFNSKNELTLRTNVESACGVDMPIGDGWHPYFMLDSKIDDLELKLPKLKKYENDSSNIPVPDPVVFDRFDNMNRIGDYSADNAYELDEGDNDVCYILRNAISNVEVHIEHQAGENAYNYVQIFTPPHRKSIAIEPMSCMPNAFNNGKGLCILPKNAVKKWEVKIKVLV